MDEEFAIKLKTILDQSSISKVKEQIDALSEELSEKSVRMSSSSNAEKPAITKIFDLEAERKLAEEEYEKMYRAIEQRSGTIFGIDGQEEDTRITEFEEEASAVNEIADNVEQLNVKSKETKTIWEKILTPFYILQGVVGGIKEKLAEIRENSNNINHISEKSNFSLKSIVKSIGKTLLAFIGIRGVYSGIRKAMSSYLGQNEELQQKLNACWYALGSLLAPALEKIVSLFSEAVAFVDYLVKAIGGAGINMDRFGKSAKNANKQLAGFDEINNISENNNGAIGIQAINDAINGMDEKLKSLATNLGLTIKDVFFDWNFTPENITEKLGVFSGTVLGGIIGACLGGPAGFIAGASIGAAISLLGSMKIFNHDGKLSDEELGKAIVGFGSTILGGVIGAALLGPIGAAIGAIALSIPMLVDFKFSLGGSGSTAHALMQKEAKALGISAKQAYQLGLKGTEEDKKILEGYGIDCIDGIESGLDKRLAEKESDTKTIFERIGNWFKELFGIHSPSTVFEGYGKNLLDGLKQGISNKIQEILNKFTEIKSGILNNTLFTTDWKSKGSAILTSIKTGLSNKWTELKSWWSKLELPSFKIKTPHLSWTSTPASGFIADVLEFLGMPTSLPKLNISWYKQGGLFSGPQVIGVGEYSDAVNNPEVVAPLDRLQGMINGGNEETNELLRELISIVDTKEFRTYISQSEIGKSAVNYINNQSRILGESLV